MTKLRLCRKLTAVALIAVCVVTLSWGEAEEPGIEGWDGYDWAILDKWEKGFLVAGFILGMHCTLVALTWDEVLVGTLEGISFYGLYEVPPMQVVREVDHFYAMTGRKDIRIYVAIRRRLDWGELVEASRKEL